MKVIIIYESDKLDMYDSKRL